MQCGAYSRVALAAAILFVPCVPACAATATTSPEPLYLFGIPVDFILFALTLLGVALLHHYTLQVALAGLAAITVYKLGFTGFKFGAGLGGLALHMQHEWVILANLFLLLMGFALLSRHFEESKLPDVMPAYLPDDWKGAFALLVIVCVLSSFLDNIAAALIGGVMAREVFRHKVHIGYLAAIVAASNAGGAGSVVGDTTTTMMWIAGVSPLSVVEAYVAVSVAIFIFGIPAAMQQQKYSPIMRDAPAGIRIDWSRVVIVFAILVVAILSNVIANLRFPAALDVFPVIGASVWVVLLVTTPWRNPDWKVMPETFKGIMADRDGARLRVGGVRQHPAHRAGAEAGRLRLGLPRLCGRLRRLDDLVRLVRRRRACQHVSGGEVGRALAAPRLARRHRLCDRLLLHARHHRLAPRRAALNAARGRASPIASRAGRSRAAAAGRASGCRS
jgi:hypothetical protein